MVTNVCPLYAKAVSLTKSKLKPSILPVRDCLCTERREGQTPKQKKRDAKKDEGIQSK